MAVIDINDLFRGKDEYIDFPVAELGGSVEIRPLTEGENSEVQALKLRGISTEVETGTGKVKPIQMDTSLAAKNDFDANVRVIILACRIMSDEKYVHLNPDQVINLRPVGVVKKIAEEILKISGETTEAEAFLDSFRKDKKSAHAVQPSRKRV